MEEATTVSADCNSLGHYLAPVCWFYMNHCQHTGPFEYINLNTSCIKNVMLDFGLTTCCQSNDHELEGNECLFKFLS